MLDTDDERQRALLAERAASLVLASRAGGLLTVGEETMRRDLLANNINLNTGAMRLSYFTARKTEVIANIRTMTGTNAAGATPTLCRMGLYTVDASGNLTLVASCANDTSLWAAASTVYSKALSAAYLKVAGQRYAFASLIVTAAAVPTLVGQVYFGPASEYAVAPAVSTLLSAQTDLPASVTVGSLSAAAQNFYGVVTP